MGENHAGCVYIKKIQAAIAPMVEQHFGKVKVPGSNPGGGTNNGAWAEYPDHAGSMIA